MRLTEDDGLVIGVLKKDGRPMTVRGIAERAGLTYDRACRSTRILGKLGVLERTNGCWKPADAIVAGDEKGA